MLPIRIVFIARPGKGSPWTTTEHFFWHGLADAKLIPAVPDEPSDSLLQLHGLALFQTTIEPLQRKQAERDWDSSRSSPQVEHELTRVESFIEKTSPALVVWIGSSLFAQAFSQIEADAIEDTQEDESPSTFETLFRRRIQFAGVLSVAFPTPTRRTPEKTIAQRFKALAKFKATYRAEHNE